MVLPLGQSGPESDGNEGVPRIPQSSKIPGASPSDCLVSYVGHSLGGGLTLLQRCSWCILQPQARISWWTNRTSIAFLCPHKMYQYWWRADSQYTSLCVGVVNSDGNVMPPFIFPHGLRLNTGANVKCTEDLVQPFIKGVAANWTYDLQQNSVPCHTSKKTHSWVLKTFCNPSTPNIWPPNSPNCNPLDYYV